MVALLISLRVVIDFGIGFILHNRASLADRGLAHRLVNVTFDRDCVGSSCDSREIRRLVVVFRDIDELREQLGMTFQLMIRTLCVDGSLSERLLSGLILLRDEGFQFLIIHNRPFSAVAGLT